jgi:hypothetical protein
LTAPKPQASPLIARWRKNASRKDTQKTTKRMSATKRHRKTQKEHKKRGDVKPFRAATGGCPYKMFNCKNVNYRIFRLSVFRRRRFSVKKD